MMLPPNTSLAISRSGIAVDTDDLHQAIFERIRQVREIRAYRKGAQGRDLFLDSDPTAPDLTLASAGTRAMIAVQGCRHKGPDFADLFAT